jgi:hypothetical protein
VEFDFIKAFPEDPIFLSPCFMNTPVLRDKNHRRYFKGRIVFSSGPRGVKLRKRTSAEGSVHIELTSKI